MKSMSPNTELKIVLKREVGIKSREHVEGFSSVTTFLSVSVSTRSKHSIFASLPTQVVGKSACVAGRYQI